MLTVQWDKVMPNAKQEEIITQKQSGVKEKKEYNSEIQNKVVENF